MARPAVLAVVCAVFIATGADASPLRTCPSTCVCRHTVTVNKADCRDIPEWDLKSSDAQVVRIMPPPHPVPSSPLILSRLDMFPKVQMLSVTNRSIVELTSGNLPTLQVLDLSNNKISRFNDRTFHHMPVLRQLNLAGNPISLKRGIPLLKSSSIRTLDLGYSGLTHIPEGSLSGIPNLTSLYLQGNPLKLLESCPLVDRVSIQELDLSYCKLTRIPNHSLDNLVNLQRLYLKGNDLKTILVGVLPVNLHYLDLSANRIRDVPLSPLSALKNLTNLELAKNPVRCTCELITFLDRMAEQNVISEKMIVCAEPGKYTKVPWKDIDERELCKDDDTSEESTDSSSDDDSGSTSVSFEKDDISYEVDGPTEEENRIMSQHPPPLSLQTLLQKPSRYQNMEENSIQSDQPYSNTSDEGSDRINDFPATTVETISHSHEEADDDLIVSSGAEPDYDGGKYVTTSTEGSSDVEDSETKGKDEDDSIVVPELRDNEDDVGKMDTTTESQDKHTHNDDSQETTIRLDAASREDPNTSRVRESLESEKEQKEDSDSAPDAYLAVEERTGTPLESLKASEDSTENPDSETFLRNEETIAMGKLMPESQNKSDEEDKHSSKTSETDEKVELHVIPGSHSEETEIESNHSHFTSTPSTSAEVLSTQSEEKGHDESSSRSVSDEIVSTSEGFDMSTKETEETFTDHHELITVEGENHKENSHEAVLGTEEPHDETTEKPHSLNTLETKPNEDDQHRSQEVRTDSEDAKTSHDAASTVQVEPDERTISPLPSQSAENALENGEFESLETTQRTSGEMGVSFESIETHSDNETEHVEAKTESASSDLDTQEHPNKNAMPEFEDPVNEDTIGHEHASTDEHKHGETNASTESMLAATEVLDTHDPYRINDKEISQVVPSSSPNPSDDIEAQLASIFITLPSLTEHHVNHDESTTLKSETTTHHEAETNTGGLGSVFPLYLIPGFGGDKKQNPVSEPEGSTPNNISLHDSSLDDSVSEPVDSSIDSEPAPFPSEPSNDDQTKVDQVENNLARISDSEDVVMTEESDVQLATIAYVVIAAVIICIIIAVACVSMRTRPDKNRKGSAPVRIRGDNVSPGTEMKDMMNPLLEPVAENQTANEFHDDPTVRPSLVSLELNGQNEKFPVLSPVPKENGLSDKGRISNGGPTQDPAYRPIPMDEPNDVTEVVIEATASNGGVSSPPSQNGFMSAAPINGKPPRQNGTAKVKVVAGVIPPAVPRIPVYVEKVVGDS